MKRRTRRSGTERLSRSVLLLTVAALLIGGSATASPKDKKGSQKPVESYSLVAGTVFQESGFALPGADVVLTPAPEGLEKPPIKPQRAKADARGEFAFRVASAPMRYLVSASAKGFEKQEKAVSVQGEERTDVTLVLPPSSNK